MFSWFSKFVFFFENVDRIISVLIRLHLFWQAKRTLKAHRLQDELASGKLDQTVS